ncbi:MAG: AraC family transcriptional regulator [Eubacteriales bacterium]
MNKQSSNNSSIINSDCPQNIFYNAPIPVSQDSVLIRINRSGSVEQTPPEFSIRRDQSYSYNAIHFITSGSGSLQVGTTTYHLSAGKIFIINAFEPHSYQSNPRDPMGLLWIEFTGNDVSRLVRQITNTVSHVVTGSIDLFTLCADLIMNPQQNAINTSEQIYHILMELYRKTSHLTKKQDAIQQSIQSYIDHNLKNDLSLHTIAKHFGYNPNYFSERFKRSTGITYNHYVNQRRVAQACSMLALTNLSVDQIGENLGFYDTSHFIKHFQKIMKVSPSTYRASNTYLF